MRPQRDLNPCFRRERANWVSFHKAIKTKEILSCNGFRGISKLSIVSTERLFFLPFLSPLGTNLVQGIGPHVLRGTCIRRSGSGGSVVRGWVRLPRLRSVLDVSLTYDLEKSTGNGLIWKPDTQ